MRVDVLGPVAVRHADAAVAVGGPRQRAVLAVLALFRGRSVSVAALADAVWSGVPPRTADHTLHNYVLRLRRLGLAIERIGDGYQLDSPTDADEVKAAIDKAHDLHGAPREQRLAAAVALVRGEPVQGLPDTDLTRAPRAALTELIETVREDAAAAQLDLATDPAASGRLIAALRGLVTAAPYRERRWELLVLGLYRAGRQSEALEAFAEARDLLARELGIDPSPGLRRLQQAVLSQDPALSLAPAVAGASVGGRALPGLATRLIGRAAELTAVADALAASRLVSIVGPMGAGKTRLALEVAREVAGEVWFVSLEGVTAPTTVAEAVLGVVSPASRSSEAVAGVVAALAVSDGLLVIDAAEQQVEQTTDMVTRLVFGAPLLRILLTTRQRLRLRDEAVVSLGALTVADSRALLLDRARLGDPGFALGADDAAVADRLCGLVDGLPLGIELVARHLRLMPIRELANRVDADLDRWTEGDGDAGAGLVRAVAATVDELTAELRAVLVRMSVFPAEVDLALAHEVVAPGSGDDAMFDALATLVDRSLLQVRSGSVGVRYGMLLSVRRHCVGLIEESERASVEAEYVAAVVRRCVRLAADLHGPDRAATVAILDADAPHLRAALARSVDSSDPTPALRAAAALGEYWLARRPNEGMAWLARLLAVSDITGVERAAVLLQMGHLSYWLTDFGRGTRLLAEARGLVDPAVDPILLGRILRRLGAIAAARDDVATARDRLGESLLVLRDAGDPTEEAISALHLGSLLADEGRSGEALPLLVRARDLLRAAGDPLQEGHALSALSLAWWKSGDLVAARGAAEQAIERFRELGHLPSEGVVAYRLAAICRNLGDSERSRHYADLALADGTTAGTRTTTALAELALARLDLDAGDVDAAAVRVSSGLDGLDVAADRWVLAEALEVTARLQLMRAQPAAAVLSAAADLRQLIGQPAAPADAAETAELMLEVQRRDPARPGAAPSATDAAGLRAWALDLCFGAIPAAGSSTRSAPRS